MSRRSPGKRSGRAITLCVTAALCLLSNGAWAEDEQARSGHVTPTVTTLSVRVFEGTPRIEEYRLPSEYSGPYGLAIDGAGIIWVTLNAENSLGRFDPVTREYREYRIPSARDLPEVGWEYDEKNRTTPEKTVTNYSVGNPGHITVAPDGSIWMVTLLGNSLLRFDPTTEVFTEYLFQTPNSQPYDLAAGADGRIWFALKNVGMFGYLDPAREKVVEIPLGDNAQPMGIALDKEGNVWIGDVNGNRIGRYDPTTKSFRSYTINTPMAQPGMMRFDRDGRLWFCQVRTKQMGVLIPDPGIFSVVDIPGYNTTPQALVTVSNKALWMVDSMMNRIGRFDLADLTWRIIDIKTANAQPMDVEVDPNGDIWFTENDRHANAISRLVVSTMGSASDLSNAGERPRASTAAMDKSGWAESYSLLGGLAFLAIVALGGWTWSRRSGRRG